jgi:hypothetical protein
MSYEKDAKFNLQIHANSQNAVFVLTLRYSGQGPKIFSFQGILPFNSADLQTTNR